MLSIYWPTVGNHRNVTVENTFLLDRQLTKNVGRLRWVCGDFQDKVGHGISRTSARPIE